MASLLHDIINDPGEYAPFLFLLGGVIFLWAALCMSGVISLRAATRRRRFWFSLPTLLLGLPCVLGNIPISIESQGFRINVDLRWLFLVPVLLGVAGLAFWGRAKREAIAQPAT